MNRNTRRRASGPSRGAHTWGRRGSVYVLTLGVAVTVTVIGLASVAISRVNARGVTRSNDWAEAQLLAFTAAEHALTQIDRSGDWREEFDGVTTSESFGKGTFSWRVVDESDGDLTDDASDPAVVIATGLVGDANYSVSLLLNMQGGPLEALRTCVTANNEFKVDPPNYIVTPTGSCIHTNVALDNMGTVDGNVEADSIQKLGTVTGTVTVPAPPLAMPDPDVFDMYKALATTIPRSATLEKMVISPQTAPGGVTNPDGVYYMDTDHANLTIRMARIHGTLVIDCIGMTVTVEDSVFMHSYRSDYPVLIVNGTVVVLKYLSDEKTLSESEHNTNFNPPGSPYAGQSDSDTSDEYPNEIQGLVHATGNVLLKETARIRGTIIAEDKVQCQGNNQIIYQQGLYDNPPVGYTGYKVLPDAWKRNVD